MGEPCSQEKTINHLLKQHETVLQRMASGDTAFELIKKELSEIKRGQETTNTAMATFNKRMFIDNGTTSFQTKIDRHETVIKFVVWLASAVALATIGQIAYAVIQH